MALTQTQTHKHGQTDTMADRVQTCTDHNLIPLWKILPPIWVTIHALMPSPSNPCPAGQGYMAVHQGSHNSACFIAPSVHHRISLRRRRAAKDAECTWDAPISHRPAKKLLNCEHQTSWPAQAGNSLIWTFYKALGTSTISLNTFSHFALYGFQPNPQYGLKPVIVDLNSSRRSSPNSCSDEETRK